MSGPNGEFKVFKAVLDPGSTHTLISEKVANTLKLKREATEVFIKGVNEFNSIACKRVMVSFKDRVQSILSTDCLTS